MRATQFSPEDLAFIEECMAAYFARLPATHMLGHALPNIPLRAHRDLAALVPQKMWDGPPDADGVVRWKRLTASPPRSIYFMAYGHLVFDFFETWSRSGMPRQVRKSWPCLSAK
jgi:hypothetical protein